MAYWLGIVTSVLGSAGLGTFLFLLFYFIRQGDDAVTILPDQVSKPKVEWFRGGIRITFRLPIANEGRQKGMFVELLCRPEYLGSFMKDLDFAPRFELPGRKGSGYWAAFLMEKRKRLDVEVILAIRGTQEALKSLMDLGYLSLVFHYKVIGRRGMKWRLAEVRLPL